MRKILSIILAIAIVFSFTAAMAEEKVVSVEVNGKAMVFDVDPIIVEGRTLVPLRAIFEELGAQVAWEDEDQTVTSFKGDTVVILQIGTPTIFINNESKELDVPAQLVNSRTLVPLRAVSEAFGAQVDWSEAEWKVTITTKAEEAAPSEEVKPAGENILLNSECDDIESVWNKAGGQKNSVLSVEKDGDNSYISLSKRTAYYEGIEQKNIADALNKNGVGKYQLTGKIKFDGASTPETAEVYIIANSLKEKYTKYNTYNKIENVGGEWQEFSITIDTSALEFTTWPADASISIKGNKATFNAETALCIDDVKLVPVDTKVVEETDKTETTPTTSTTPAAPSTSGKGEASNVTKEEAAKNILVNGGMDSEEAWSKAGGIPKAVTLTYEEEDGNKYLKFAGRTADWMGVEQLDLAAKLKPGKTYVIKALVKIENDTAAAGAVEFYLLSKENKDYKYYKKISNIGDAWKNIEFEITLSEDDIPADTKVNIRAATAAIGSDTATYNLCLDDITIIEK